MASVSKESNLEVAAQYRCWFEAIEGYDRAQQPVGSAGGPIGSSGLQVAKEIANQAENGVVNIPIEVLASCVGHTRQTVSNAIRRLQNAGFIFYQPGSRAAPAVLKPIV